ncbi:MAG: hypothetical protein ACXU8U_06700 [Asticcacaulis sp.]
MKKASIALAAGAVVALLGLSACEDDPYYYGHHHRMAYNNDDGYDIWYDNYYGGIYDGYWGDDGAYYYRPSRDRSYVRDDARHFRRDRGDGYHQMRVHDWRDRH